MGKDLDPGPLNGNDPCRRGGVTSVGGKMWVVRWTDQTEYEHANDVEQEDTNPNTTNGTRYVLCRVVSFGGGDSDNLGAQEGVGSTDHNGPEPSKTTQSSWNVIELNERAGITLCQANTVIPLATLRIMVRYVPSNGIPDGHEKGPRPNR